MKKLFTISFIAVLILGSLPQSTAQLKLSADPLYTYVLPPDLVLGGTKGSDQGQFNEPDSVYVDADGTIYAGDTTNLRVQVFAKNGTFLYAMTGFTGTDVDINNEVQGIVELSNGTIVVVEKTGNLLYFNKGDTSPYAKTALPAPQTDEKKRDTQGLAIDPRNDTLFVSDQPNNKILVLDANGKYLREFSTGDFTTPENMVVDTDKEIIYVSLEAKGSIGYFGLNGTFLGSFGSDYSQFNFEGLALDPTHNIIAVDEGPDEGTSKLSRIIIFDKDDFSPIAAFGGPPGSGEGQFLSPDGVAYDQLTDRVVVADQGNYRIQLFDYNHSLYIDSTGDITVSKDNLADSKFGFYMAGALFGGTYRLLQDETEIAKGEFSYGQLIQPDFTTLDVGTYNFTVAANDTNGNSATASAILTVTEAPTSPTLPTGGEDGGGGFLSIGIIAPFTSLLLLSSIIILFKRRTTK